MKILKMILISKAIDTHLASSYFDISREPNVNYVINFVYTLSSDVV